MTDVVLVHGAWHGGWCWARVLARLHDAGVPALAVTLSGLGDRAHLLSPAIDLETHVRDVAAVIACEELERVVLVGHSYAGLILGGVAERLEGRIGRLVYLDALVPQTGQSALELFPESVARAITDAASAAGGCRVPPWPASSFGVTDVDDRRWVDRRLTDHPLATFAQDGRPPPSSIPRQFIACTARQRDTYVRFAKATRTDRGWDSFELSTGHDAMITAPGDLTGLWRRAALLDDRAQLT